MPNIQVHKWGQRPEATRGGGSVHYSGGEATRYTYGSPQTAQIQNDMTRCALELLGVDASHLGVVLDVGCGSGLSGRVLTETGLQWVGLDISTDMLQLAAQDPACTGRVCQSAMQDGLPLRSGAFDAVISISAVQWLVALPHPLPAVARFFTALWRVLKGGTTAVLQVYTEDEQQADLLLAGAMDAGFVAGYFVDFPHDSPAKKYFICLHKRETPLPGLHAVRLCAHDCNVSWPRKGSCMLQWTQYLSDSGLPAQGEPPAVTLARARMQQEHAQVGRRCVRLLRRATHPPAECCSAASSAAPEGLVWVDAEVQHTGLMPCGGVVIVNLTLPSDQLACCSDSAVGSDFSSGAEDSSVCIGGPDVAACREEQIEWDGSQGGESDRLPAVTALLGALLGPAARILDCSVRAASADQAAQQGMSWPRQIAAVLERPAAQGAFFWVEAVPPTGEACSSGSSSSSSNHKDASTPLGQNIRVDTVVGAVLHAQKLPQQLVTCVAHSSLLGGGGAAEVAATAARVEALCATLNASVIAADVRCGSGGELSSAWLLYVSGLQHADTAAVWQEASACLALSV